MGFLIIFYKYMIKQYFIVQIFLQIFIKLVTQLLKMPTMSNSMFVGPTDQLCYIIILHTHQHTNVFFFPL